MKPDVRAFEMSTNIEPPEAQDTVELLKSENAYLRGKIEVYEKFLKDKGYIKEESEELP